MRGEDLGETSPQTLGSLNQHRCPPDLLCLKICFGILFGQAVRFDLANFSLAIRPE
jgi:hypothetical protein